MHYLDLEIQLYNGTVNTKILLEEGEITRHNLESKLPNYLLNELSLQNFEFNGDVITLDYSHNLHIELSRDEAISLGINADTFDNANSYQDDISDVILNKEVNDIKKVYVISGDVLVHETNKSTLKINK